MGKAHTWPSFELTQDPSREPSAIDLQAKDWRTEELLLKHTGKRPFRERLCVGFESALSRLFTRLVLLSNTSHSKDVIVNLSLLLFAEIKIEAMQTSSMEEQGCDEALSDAPQAST